MHTSKELVRKLIKYGSLELDEYATLLREYTEQDRLQLQERAVELRRHYYGEKVFVRGLIEFTNYCKNNCYYCGIQASNQVVPRYRLSKEEILACCETGWDLGFRTFVLQGGEDLYFTEERMVDIISSIKSRYPDAAITLSIGEKSEEVYRRYKEAGANRYLLRHETANEAHYKMLHPETMSLSNRKRCLFTLKRLGFETGAGFMVGSPGQTEEHLAGDLVFLQELQPHMVGIGPFIPHHDTRFGDEKAGSLEKTYLLLSILRILLPKCNLPATTALGTLHPRGRELGIQAGANVVMPNLSPLRVRKQYELYDNKNCTGAEAAESIEDLRGRMTSIGYQVVTERGDSVAQKYERLKK